MLCPELAHTLEMQATSTITEGAVDSGGQVVIPIVGTKSKTPPPSRGWEGGVTGGGLPSHLAWFTDTSPPRAELPPIYSSSRCPSSVPLCPIPGSPELVGLSVPDSAKGHMGRKDVERKGITRHRIYPQMTISHFWMIPKPLW